MELQYDEWIPVSNLSSLSISWDDVSEMNAYYTFVIYDIDAPSTIVNSVFIHMLVINIPGNNISRGQIIVPYTPPNPPPGSGQHRYMVELYKQTGMINMTPLSRRERFNITQFISQHRLINVMTDRFIVDSRPLGRESEIKLLKTRRVNGANLE